MATYLPSALPAPQPDLDDLPFWEFCKARELRIQECADCGTLRHPPMPACPVCRSMRTSWRAVPGTGSVYSFTICHYSAHASLKETVPYNVSVILLDETPDIRIVSNVIDVPPEEMAIGLRVELAWEEHADGFVLPRFRRAA
ncbi:OB-fold domain-containing protein [Aquabacter sp. CN5-332]|uniref:Zn-ribbon domain-containing OB-fold protein n=1 Tax=Aquabacter sp. CN5-332 TaxID=3156608 RepID=UPI0032B4A4B1